MTQGDEAAVKELVKNTFSHFLAGNYWEWKYVRNPSFDRSLVVVADNDGVVVGCHHWLVRDIKVTKSLSIRSILGADLAVDPSQRGKGISKSLLLFLRSKDIIRSKGIVMSYGFIDPRLAKRLHRPSIGFIYVPTSTVAYTKLLNWNRINSRIQKLIDKLRSESKFADQVAKLNLKIGLRISGAPPLLIRIADGKIEVREEKFQNADITVRSDLATIAKLRQKERRTERLLKALLTRKVKIHGSFSNILRFYRNYFLFKEILNIVS